MTNYLNFNDVLAVGYGGNSFIIEEYWSDYSAEINSLYQDIHSLFNQLFILEKLLGFPFQFLGIRNSPFISTVIFSFFSSSIILVSKLLDTDNASISLVNLKDQLIKKYLKTGISRSPS